MSSLSSNLSYVSGIIGGISWLVVSICIVTEISPTSFNKGDVPIVIWPITLLFGGGIFVVSKLIK